MTFALALLSGVPALVYQVAWTREVALLAGSHVEAISVVLVAFFGGLALGARFLGAMVDRAGAPLRIYGALEIGAGALAAGSALALPALEAIGAPGGRLGVSAMLLLPATFLLGGTLPALLRASSHDLAVAPGRAGWLTAANTAGSVAGVGLAIVLIPSLGLRMTLISAGAGATALGLGALAWGWRRARPKLSARERAGPGRASVLAAAGVAGVSTLAFEVIAARMSALVLGSSLYAWGAVLGLVLLGLAVGNALGARRAVQSDRPVLALGWIEAGAALALCWGAIVLSPGVTTPAAGVSLRTVSAVASAIFPAALCMGAAFPFFVRLALAEPSLGRTFGAVTAANTAGGIAGALLAPFVLLPALGLVGGVLACAALNLALASALMISAAGLAGGALRGLPIALCVWLAAARALAPLPVPDGHRILYVDHGRQATAVVLHAGNRRDLLVDGDREASTGGSARRTEELLAALPLLLHPSPREFLEVGLGSGITLATAARFPLATVRAVEIADSVVRASRFFAPDNGDPAAGGDPRVRVLRGDGRVHLAQHPARYDVIAANTLQPWSVGATGLYSREYFAKVAGALRPDGIAVQWLPVEHVGADSLGAILRTFFSVFEHGGLWWGHGNLIVVGARAPLPSPDPDEVAKRLREADLDPALGLRVAGDLEATRIADARAVREALGPGEILSDDRPVLERRAALRRASGDAVSPLALVLEIARLGARGRPLGGALVLWIEAQQARAAGNEERWLSLAALAEEAGLAFAASARGDHLLERGRRALRSGDPAGAKSAFRRAASVPGVEAAARFGLGLVSYREGSLEEAEGELETLVARAGSHAEAWNLLGVVRLRAGDVPGAAEAFDRALAADPYLAEALVNAGRLAAEHGHAARAERMLERLRESSPLAVTAAEHALAETIEAAGAR